MDIRKGPNHWDSVFKHPHTKRLPLPTDSHAEILSRVIDQRRPVNAKGDAYRDTLLWLTLLKLAAESNGPIAFVTQDNDFAQGEGLHPELRDDLKRVGVDQNRLLFYSELAAFNSSIVAPSLRGLKEIARGARLQTIPGWISRNLPEELACNYEDELADSLFNGVFPSSGTTMVSGVEVTNIEIGEARRLSTGEVVFPANVDVEADISVEVSEDDLHRSPELRDILDQHTEIGERGAFSVAVRVLYDPNVERATLMEVVGITAA